MLKVCIGGTVRDYGAAESLHGNEARMHPRSNSDSKIGRLYQYL